MPKGFSPYTSGTIASHRIRNLAQGIQVEFEGDWQKLSLGLGDMPIAIKSAAIAAQVMFANQFRAKLIENIDNNGASIGWPDLRPRYKTWKNRQGLQYSGEDIYKLTGQYRNAIDVIVKGTSVYVGVSKSKDMKSHFGNLTVSQYAHILEVGSFTRNINPRPLWGPTFQQMGGRKALLKKMHEHLNLKTYSYGITFG